jgi:hypothetical protein
VAMCGAAVDAGTRAVDNSVAILFSRCSGRRVVSRETQAVHGGRDGEPGWRMSLFSSAPRIPYSAKKQGCGK